MATRKQTASSKVVEVLKSLDRSLGQLPKLEEFLNNAKKEANEKKETVEKDHNDWLDSLNKKLLELLEPLLELLMLQ